MEAPQVNGIALGTLAALINIAFKGMRGFGLDGIITAALTIVAGWLGSRLISRK